MAYKLLWVWPLYTSTAWYGHRPHCPSPSPRKHPPVSHHRTWTYTVISSECSLLFHIFNFYSSPPHNLTVTSSGKPPLPPTLELYRAMSLFFVPLSIVEISHFFVRLFNSTFHCVSQENRTLCSPLNSKCLAQVLAWCWHLITTCKVISKELNP